MKSPYVVRTHGPMSGQVVFAYAAAAKPQGPCVANLGLFACFSHRGLDRAEEPMPPGEAGA